MDLQTLQPLLSREDRVVLLRYLQSWEREHDARIYAAIAVPNRQLGMFTRRDERATAPYTELVVGYAADRFRPDRPEAPYEPGNRRIVQGIAVEIRPVGDHVPFRMEHARGPPWYGEPLVVCDEVDALVRDNPWWATTSAETGFLNTAGPFEPPMKPCGDDRERQITEEHTLAMACYRAIQEGVVERPQFIARVTERWRKDFGAMDYAEVLGRKHLRGPLDKVGRLERLTALQTGLHPISHEEHLDLKAWLTMQHPGIGRFDPESAADAIIVADAGRLDPVESIRSRMLESLMPGFGEVPEEEQLRP